MIRTAGHWRQIRSVIFATCFTDPAAASMFDGRNRAHSKYLPQKMYNGK